jgi:pimeloyl-ACP methyl ester carboxylesterase
MSVTTVPSAGTTTVRPFTIPVTSDAELEALRVRVAATRWPDRELVSDHSQGVQLAVVTELARYWATEYDWRRCEAKLNALPHFVTEIDGLDIHFIHVRSEHENALPVVITHGWPGSVIELLAVIDPLTNPTAHGGSAADAFDVVIPSMPGYGYSGKPAETGWGPDRIARAWTELMRRLGYTRFVAQGGDWGAIVTDVMAVQAPAELIGMHTNMAGVVPADVSTALARNILGAGGPPPSGLSAEESSTYDQLNFLYTKGIGYGIEMITQPQTLYGIADSPVGLAAWMINHDAASYSGIADAFAGHLVGNLTRDEVLDNLTFYWLTNTAISSTRLYWENTFDFFGVKGVAIPAAVSVFPNEIYKAHAQLGRAGLLQAHLLQRGRPGLPLRRLAGAGPVHRRAARGVPVTALAGPRRMARTPRTVPAIRYARIAGREPWPGYSLATRRHCHERTLACARRAAHDRGPAARRGRAAVFRRRGRLAELTAADAGWPAREGGPGRLLDLHLHQLAPPASVCPGVGREILRRRTGGDRGTHA